MIADWTPEEKAMIYTIGTLTGLKAKGFLNGPDVMTPKGMQEFEELKASGYQPSQEEMETCLKIIQGGGLRVLAERDAAREQPTEGK